MNEAQQVAHDLVGASLVLVAVVATLWGFWVGRDAAQQHGRFCWCFEWLLAATLVYTFGVTFGILGVSTWASGEAVAWWGVAFAVPMVGFPAAAFYLWAKGRRIDEIGSGDGDEHD